MTFDGFQALKSDLRLMTKPGNSVKINLSLHNMKATLSLGRKSKITMVT